MNRHVHEHKGCQRRQRRRRPQKDKMFSHSYHQFFVAFSAIIIYYACAYCQGSFVNAWHLPLLHLDQPTITRHCARFRGYKSSPYTAPIAAFKKIDLGYNALGYNGMISHITNNALFSSKDNWEEDDDAETNNVKSEEEKDWRAFRAQLVQSETLMENKNEEDKEKNDSHWAYDTDGFIERGSIVLSIPSSDNIANDIDALTNQCYRKSIVLVLDVKADFIQGIILNRPTNIGVKEGMQFVQPGHGEVYENEIGGGDDEKSPPHRWKVWFGGEVGGPYSDFPQVLCLHSIMTSLGKKVSEVVLPGILLTSFDGAQSIVQAGEANPSDFWLFSGICGWDTNSFHQEMNEEGLWRVVSSDGGTILQELNLLRCEEEEELAAQSNCDVDSDPRNAGLHTWEMLMGMIGREEEARMSEDSFGDLMLREWATSVLSFSLPDQQSSMVSDFYPSSMVSDDEDNFDVSNYDPASGMAMQSKLSPQLQSSQSAGMVGTLIRASSSNRSPYILADQGFHKSLILILRDDEKRAEGVILNHVTTEMLSLNSENDLTIPIRYGGPLQDIAKEEGDELTPPLVFLHSSGSLKDAGVGIPVGSSGIFSCTYEDVVKSINAGLASPDNIMVVQGLSVWKKAGIHSGVLGDIEEGFFEIVHQDKKRVWEILMTQKQLSSKSIDKNLAISKKAWMMAGNRNMSENDSFEEEEVLVFGSNVNLSSLADEALRRWLGVYFLSDE